MIRIRSELRKPPVHSTNMRRSCSSCSKLLLAKFLKIPETFAVYSLILFPPHNLHFSFYLSVLSFLMLLQTHSDLPHLIYSLSLPPSLSFTPLSLSLPVPSFSSSLHHFSGRVLGPGLGCSWPGLLAAK